uniref:US2 family protein n=1 Tax=Anatid alphaherpesvirus 2 TaxID=3080522 RepID=A0AAU0K7C1_9ALPH
MGVAIITLVTLLDEKNRLPGRSRDATSSLWTFLIRQCAQFIDDKLGTPVVVRSADLCRFARPLLSIPRNNRPVIRTAQPAGFGIQGTGQAGLTDSYLIRLYEDGEGCSTEWRDILSGYLLLDSGDVGEGPYNLWIIGAADVCRSAIEFIPIPKRMFAVKVGGLWSGMPWEMPPAIPTILESAWEPKFDRQEDKRDFDEAGMACVYRVIGPAADPLKPMHPIDAQGPREGWVEAICCCRCRRRPSNKAVALIHPKYLHPVGDGRADGASS